MDLESIAQYRRDGYTVIRRLLTADHVAACIDALTRIAEHPSGDAVVALEPGVDPALAHAEHRADLVRKLGNFTEAEPALMRAAMSAKLHDTLNEIMGSGRILLQEMALVKPPRIGGEKRWHQDAAYFRGSDPGLMFGVWIALDPAMRENGCMEVIPGSQHGGPVPHVPHEDINLCTIRPDHLHAERRVAVPLDPGDALVFHSLIHHYTAANRSDLRRRALQFHYHQVGLEWTSLESHRALFHDEAGEYAGCTVPRGKPFVEPSSFVPKRLRPVAVMA
ncbi:MAG TPA: phytanoyl-CoA dioxygenase family protein [Acetobacteraceae bacterium]|nr:phytanoyl-CoA dioxygenase family protein [Acetobacteraceae bacterium]